MTTKKLVLDLIAFVVAIAFMISFVPWALNATDTLTNMFGVSLVVGVVIAIVATIHSRLTSSKEKQDEE